MESPASTVFAPISVLNTERRCSSTGFTFPRTRACKENHIRFKKTAHLLNILCMMFCSPCAPVVSCRDVGRTEHVNYQPIQPSMGDILCIYPSTLMWPLMFLEMSFDYPMDGLFQKRLQIRNGFFASHRFDANLIHIANLFLLVLCKLELKKSPVALFGKLRGNTLCDICVVPLLVWELPGWRRIDSNWYPHFEGPQLIPRHIPEFQPLGWICVCPICLACLDFIRFLLNRCLARSWTFIWLLPRRARRALACICFRLLVCACCFCAVSWCFFLFGLCKGRGCRFRNTGCDFVLAIFFFFSYSTADFSNLAWNTRLNSDLAMGDSNVVIAWFKRVCAWFASGCGLLSGWITRQVAL